MIGLGLTWSTLINLIRLLIYFNQITHQNAFFLNPSHYDSTIIILITLFMMIICKRKYSFYFFSPFPYSVVIPCFIPCFNWYNLITIFIVILLSLSSPRLALNCLNDIAIKRTNKLTLKVMIIIVKNLSPKLINLKFQDNLDKWNNHVWSWILFQG